MSGKAAECNNLFRLLCGRCEAHGSRFSARPSGPAYGEAQGEYVGEGVFSDADAGETPVLDARAQFLA